MNRTLGKHYKVYAEGKTGLQLRIKRESDQVVHNNQAYIEPETGKCFSSKKKTLKHLKRRVMREGKSPRFLKMLVAKSANLQACKLDLRSSPPPTEESTTMQAGPKKLPPPLRIPLKKRSLLVL